MNTAIKKTKLLFVFYLIGISILLGLSLGYNIHKENQAAKDFASVEGFSSFNKDLVYRYWASLHGGVYVPITEETPVNPHLSHLPHRDITTKDGQQLTLVNPAYMTRQVHELAKERYGIRGHITSLNPIRPENQADGWEQKALKAFEQGDTSYSSIEVIDDQEFLRFMRPLKVEQSCMKCHEKQGYQVGDIRGGITVNVPMEKYNEIAEAQIHTLILSHSGIYFLLLLLGFVNYKRFMTDLKNRNTMHHKLAEREQDLQEQNTEYQQLMQDYMAQNRKLIQARDKAEQSDKLKTAFIQNMSHEIRTPMNAIIGFSDLLIDSNITADRRKEYASVVRNSSNQLLSIINDLLTISLLETQQETVKEEEINVIALITELKSIFEVQAQAQNLDFQTSSNLTETQTQIIGDKTKLTQILSNLLSNALKFTQKGYIKLTCNLMGESLEFAVHDSGIGIKPEFQELIFERFKQADMSLNRKYGGTGLGLAISKGFAELMGGEIRVASKNNHQGAIFSLFIPYKPVTKAVSSKAILSYKPHGTILVAEDEENNFQLLEILLGENARLIHAKNGREAVQLCKSNPFIDLVLMDIKMPELNGIEAAAQIKEFLPELPVIAQTAYILQQEIASLEENPFDAVITKPINREELLRLLKMQLNKRKIAK